ncbi:MAG TPA: hypothetical protein VNR41_10200 [Xanthobacteraceae bacterium]|nr:hypothetical protein [Xanthobacteraceae bacterium]
MNRADAALSRTLFFVALGAAILNFIAFYPGILHHDAWAYFWQARDHKLDNWQPPLLGYIWMPLQKIYYGPQPMLALFVACYWSGFWLLARGYAQESRKLGIWVFAAGFFPMTLNFTGMLVKDIAMSDCFLVAAGIAVAIRMGALRKTFIALAIAWLFLFAGGFMRANALFGIPPLLDLLLSASSVRWQAIDWKKRAAASLLLSLLFIPGHLIADRHVFTVKNVKPISPLQLFDLGGITYFSGQDAFNGYFGPAFVERNKYCYSPRHWDVYGWLRCPETYENLKPEFGAPLTKRWIDGIVAHPLAYAEHRLAHFNRFLQFLCTDCKEMVESGIQSNNQNEFGFERGPVYLTLDWLAKAIDNTPFGPPYVWLLLALAWSVMALGIPNALTRHVTLALTLSGAMYVSAFVVVGIASDYRYIHWTMLCTLIATPAIAARVLLRREAPPMLRFLPIAAVIAVMIFRELVVRFAL